MRLPAEPLDDLLAELAQADAVARQLRGAPAITPKMLRVAGSESMPSSRSGEDRWKKLSACDCTICARFMMRRRRAAVGGMRTARMASQALAEAIRWLTGQMPQMRAMSDGISQKGRPSQNFSKPRNWVTWKWASSTWPCVVELDRDLGVALDAGDRVDRWFCLAWSMLRIARPAAEVGRPAGQQLAQRPRR